MTGGSSAPLRPRIRSPLFGVLKCRSLIGQSQTIRDSHAAGWLSHDPLLPGRVIAREPAPEAVLWMLVVIGLGIGFSLIASWWRDRG